MKGYLFFDTETTGLPRNWKAPMTDVDNWPRVQQLHVELFDKRFDGDHDALEDVRATARCYFELIKRGVLKED